MALELSRIRGVRLTPEKDAELVAQAGLESMTPSELIRHALDLYLEITKDDRPNQPEGVSR